MRRNLPSAVMLVLLTVAGARAHELSTSFSQIRVDGPRVEVTFTINATEMHAGPVMDLDRDGTLTEAELDDTADAAADAILANYSLAPPNAVPTVPLRTGYGFVSGNVVAFDFVYEFDEGAEQLQVVSTLDRITQSDHRHLLQIGEGAEIRQAILSRDYPSIDIDHAMDIPLWVTMKEFALLGVEHIFTGYDHLAFLVALLVATTSLRALVTIVTAFTIGHSVTLALASLDIVVVPSRLIESLIALSIAYVAIENFLGRRIVHRWLMTFLFGLVHGFGFANILRELGLTPGRLATSLFSFNAGVEAGQLAFVAIVSPLLWWAAKSTWKDAAVTASSVVIMCLGFYWFVQRAVFG